MAQISQVSVDVQIKSSAEKFYGFFRKDLHRLTQMFPKNLQSFAFLEGNDFTPGCLMQWSYDIVGPETMKLRVADVDEENKSIAYKVVQGDILRLYNFFKVKLKIQASDDGENEGATVNWSMDFEKVDENIPSPELHYLNFASKVTEGLDAYLKQQLN